MKYFTFVLFIFTMLSACAHENDTSGDEVIFDAYLLQMSSKKHLSAGELIAETALFLLGRPYVAGTLEQEPEHLVVNFRELDCMTLAETAIALTQTLRDTMPNFDLYKTNLQNLRYRNGKINNYTDRLHYTTDWIFENQRRGMLKDMTKELGGQPLKVEVSFMSEHPESYKQLNGNPELIAAMARYEKEINARQYYYIPTAEIETHASKFMNGDIICFVTSIKGLDVSHVGIIYRTDDRLTFIHASTRVNQVVIEPMSLQEYMLSVPKNTGIMIVRPQF